ncbi:hypothetical protein B0H21DRAFT_714116 [Amylocystis lapponica]|nr:hypothetical protein B0H21DRAFT_714116 [Amylocystis lapponica]
MSKHHESTTSTPKPAAHPLVGPLSIVQRTAQSVGHPELETTSAQSPVSASTSSPLDIDDSHNLDKIADDVNDRLSGSGAALIDIDDPYDLDKIADDVNDRLSGSGAALIDIDDPYDLDNVADDVDDRLSGSGEEDVIVVTSDDDDMYGAESNIPKYTHSQIESDDDGDQTVPTYTRSQIELDDDGDRIASVVQLLVLIFYFTSDRQVDPVSDYTPTPPSRVPSDNATRRKSRNASSSARTAQVLSQASSSISGTARTIMPHSPPSPSESRRKKKARVIVPTM